MFSKKVIHAPGTRLPYIFGNVKYTITFSKLSWFLVFSFFCYSFEFHFLWDFLLFWSTRFFIRDSFIRKYWYDGKVEKVLKKVYQRFTWFLWNFESYCVKILRPRSFRKFKTSFARECTKLIWKISQNFE